MFIRFCNFYLLLLLMHSTYADSALSSLRDEIENVSNLTELKLILVKTINIMEQQEAELKKLRSTRTTEISSTVVQNLKADFEIQQSEIEDLQEQLDWKLDFHGYFNTNFVHYEQNSLNLPDTFDQEHTALFIRAERDNLTFFGELEWSNSGANQGQERAWVEYKSRDSLNIRVGQSMVPSYWNLNHYPTLTKSINNPLINRRFLPFVYTGAEINGQVNNSGRVFSYVLYGGNGIDSSDLAFDGALSGAGRDANNRKAFGQKLKMSLDPWNIFELSLHHYEDSRNFYFDGTVIPNQADYEVFMSEFQGHKDRFEIIGAYVNSRIENKDIETVKASGWYLQPSYALRSDLDLYFRLEKIDLDQHIDTPLDQSSRLVGVRKQFGSYAGLKFEWINNDYSDSMRMEEKSFWSSFYFGF